MLPDTTDLKIKRMVQSFFLKFNTDSIMRLRQVTRGLPSSQVEELSNEPNEKLSIWELEAT